MALFHRRRFNSTLRWYNDLVTDDMRQICAQYFEPDPSYIFLSQSSFIEIEVLWPASRFFRALQGKDHELECLVRTYGGVETAAICTFLGSRQKSTPAAVTTFLVYKFICGYLSFVDGFVTFSLSHLSAYSWL